MVYVQSRNTLITSFLMFCVLIIFLRVFSGVIQDNMSDWLGLILAGRFSDLSFNFNSFDLSWVNPLNWSLGDMAESVNGWLHDLIDKVVPAVIYALNAVAIQAMIAYVRFAKFAIIVV